MKKIIILEDQPEALDILTQIVKQVLGDVVITHYSTLAQINVANNLLCDLFLVDLRLPDGLSCDVLQQFKQKHPNIPAIVTTLYDDDDLMYRALQSGADGYLLKSDGLDSIATCLQRMLQGEPPISPSIARKLMRQFTTPPPFQFESEPASEHKLHDLSKRETEVLTLIAQGMMTKQVAHKLELSKHTVNDVIKSIYKKLGIHSRAQATYQATKFGLV